MHKDNDFFLDHTAHKLTNQNANHTIISAFIAFLFSTLEQIINMNHQHAVFYHAKTLHSLLLVIQ